MVPPSVTAGPLAQAIQNHTNELAHTELRLTEIADEQKRLTERKFELRGIVATLRQLQTTPPPAPPAAATAGTADNSKTDAGTDPT